MAAEPAGTESLAGGETGWPTWRDLRRVVRLADHNTRVVVLGTMLLGISAGMIGSLALLRKRALMGDALSHATLPGIGLAFMLAPHVGLHGKSLPVLLAGAAISGVAGMFAILCIRNLTRLKDDAALGIVLSVFFGAGLALLGVIQQMDTGHAAGLESFIYGKTASMVAGDAWLIGLAGLACAAVCACLLKELKLLCFDEQFAASRGFPVVALDAVVMGLIVVVTIIGLQAVGLILMIAMLVMPAAAARFWTERMTRMTLVAAFLGGLSGMLGSATSAIFPGLPSGAMIVLVAALFFLASLVLGSARGVLVRFVGRLSLHARIHRQHLLRAVHEQLEARGAAATTGPEPIRAVPLEDLWAAQLVGAAPQAADSPSGTRGAAVAG